MLEGKPNIFTSHTDDYWRLVRKGVAPAFSPKNIRYAPSGRHVTEASSVALPTLGGDENCPAVLCELFMIRGSSSEACKSAVREVAAEGLRCCSCRKGFGHVLQVNQQLVSILEDSAGAEIDLDNAALRVTLDVIGRVGFGKDFGATRDLNSGKANLAFDMMEAGMSPPCKSRVAIASQENSPACYRYLTAMETTLATSLVFLRLTGRNEGIKRFINPVRKYMQFLAGERFVTCG